jgi:hypothetical protein
MTDHHFGPYSSGATQGVYSFPEHDHHEGLPLMFYNPASQDPAMPLGIHAEG